MGVVDTCMTKTLRRSVLVLACAFALSFAAGLLVRYARDGYLGGALLTRGDVVRALRQEGLDLRRSESTEFKFVFDAAQDYTYQADEMNRMTLHLYIFESVAQREVISTSLAQEGGYGMPDPMFVARNILLYPTFHARNSELEAQLEHAISRMDGGRIQWRRP